jgi:hypothetical protein
MRPERVISASRAQLVLELRPTLLLLSQLLLPLLQLLTDLLPQTLLVVVSRVVST